MLMEKLNVRMQNLVKEQQTAKQTILLLEEHLKNSKDSLQTIIGHINELTFLMNEIQPKPQDAAPIDEPSKEQTDGPKVDSESNQEEGCAP